LKEAYHLKEAYLYKKLTTNKIRCDLCSHRCVISEGGKGKCYVRENRNGTLHTLVYENIIAENIDPIEKKTTISFLAWYKIIINCHSWMQFQMLLLPELANFSNAL